MATSSLPNIKVTSPKAGTFDIVLKCKTGDLVTEKVVPVVFNPDPTPPVPPVETPFPVTSFTSADPVTLSRPAYMASVIEDMFGYDVKITRVSTSAASNPTYFPGNTAAAYVFDHGYSTRQAWSRNGTYLRLGNRLLCNGSTYAPLKYLDSSYKLWSNVNDDKLYCFYKAGYVRIFRPSKMAFEAGYAVDLRTISGIDASPNMTVGNYEGNLSMDDSRLILNCSIGGKPRNILVNPTNGQIYWNKSNADFNTGAEGMNTLTVSQSGKYILTNRNLIGGVTSQNKQSFNIDGSIIQANLGQYSHREVAFTADNLEMLIGTNPPVMHNILTGVQTILLSTDTMEAALQESGGSIQVYGGHSSGRAYELRGWMFHSGSSAEARYKEQLFVKMDGSEDVMRICNARMTDSRGQGPQGTPNWDGSKILFASDWGNAAGPIDAYIAELA